MVGDGGVTSNGGGLRGDGEAQRRQRSGEERERERERETERQGRAWKEVSGAVFGELVDTSGPNVTWYFL